MYERTRLFYFILIAILSSLYGILYFKYPVIFDDCSYVAFSHGEYGSWEYFISTIEGCLDRWQWDTGRLCNLVVAPFLSLFPKWVFDVFTIMFVFLIFQGGIVFSNANPFGLRNSMWLLVVAFAIPWRDLLFTTVFSINYIWTSALAGVFIYLQARGCRKTDNPKYCTPTISKWVLLLFGFIVGWWHEGMTVPLFAALFIYHLCRYILAKEKPIQVQIFAFAGLSMGLMMFFGVPGFMNSFTWRDNKLFNLDFHWTLYNLLLFNCFFPIYLILLIRVFLVKRIRVRMVENVNKLSSFIAIAVFGVVSTSIYYAYFTGPRCGIFNQLVCSIGILKVLPYFSLPNFLTNKKFKFGVSLVCYCLLYINISVALYFQNRLSAEAEDVLQMMNNTDFTDKPRQIFYDFTPNTRGLDTYKPSYPAVINYTQIYNVSVLPTALKSFKSAKDAISCSSEGHYIYKNMILVSGYVDYNDANYEITLSDGKKVVTTAYQQIFIDSLGKPYIYPAIRYTQLHPDAVIIDAVRLNH